MIKYRRILTRPGQEDPWWQKDYEFTAMEEDTYTIIEHFTNDRGDTLCRFHNKDSVEMV